MIKIDERHRTRRSPANIQSNVCLSRLPLLLAGTALLVGSVACSHKEVIVATPPKAVRSDNSYVDLQPGWTLRIVLPLLNSGKISSDLIAQEVKGNTISLSAPDVAGYSMSHYTVNGKQGVGVRLRFVSAEETRNGETIQTMSPPALPFELPRKTGNVRLIYLVRVSQADHNMAIAASKSIEALNAFTKRLREDPSVCHINPDVFCSWVPAGIAVRPETR